jgi:hypothetical protein
MVASVSVREWCLQSESPSQSTLDLRFGSLADISMPPLHVRSAPESGIGYVSFGVRFGSKAEVETFHFDVSFTPEHDLRRGDWTVC